jgi:ABC-2 type transport system permease protein
MLRFGQSAEIFAWGFNFLVMGLSGVFNPVEAIPGPLQPIANALPTTHAFAALRAVLEGRPLPWADIDWGLIGGVVVAVAGLVFATSMLRLFRKRGYITRFS